MGANLGARRKIPDQTKGKSESGRRVEKNNRGRRNEKKVLHVDKDDYMEVPR